MTANWTSWFGSSKSDRRTLKVFGDFVYSKKRAAAILSSGSGDFSTRASSGIETFGSRLEIASTRFDLGKADVCTDCSNRSCSASGKTLRSRQCKRQVTIDILSVGSDLTFGRLRAVLRKGAARGILLPVEPKQGGPLLVLSRIRAKQLQKSLQHLSIRVIAKMPLANQNRKTSTPLRWTDSRGWRTRSLTPSSLKTPLDWYRQPDYLRLHFPAQPH
jgi:hypothetical protein